MCVYVLFENVLRVRPSRVQNCHITLTTFNISLNILHLAVDVYISGSNDTAEPVWMAKLYAFHLVNALADTCIEQYSVLAV
jgi:hypothetical protein